MDQGRRKRRLESGIAPMITVRKAEDIYQAQGEIENGTFTGRWHFSFGEYYDPDYIQFGTLRVFNDDTLSPGAVWPLHPHREIEVVTYCAEGEFRHADEHGKGGVLQKGWVQHTTVGKGMFHSEINHRPDQRMRFIQMWFMPHTPRPSPRCTEAGGTGGTNQPPPAFGIERRSRQPPDCRSRQGALLLSPEGRDRDLQISQRPRRLSVRGGRRRCPCWR
jgi:hypothetical protein